MSYQWLRYSGRHKILNTREDMSFIHFNNSLWMFNLLSLTDITWLLLKLDDKIIKKKRSMFDKKWSVWFGWNCNMSFEGRGEEVGAITFRGLKHKKFSESCNFLYGNFNKILQIYQYYLTQRSLNILSGI